MNSYDCIVQYNFGMNGTQLSRPVSIYVGNNAASRDRRFMIEKGIGVIVNCARELPNVFEDSSITYYNVPVYDNGDPNEVAKMYGFLPSIVERIYNEIKQGKNILIHCAAGAQRSCTVLAAYLMRYHRLSLRNAVGYIKSRREIAFFHGANFQDALTNYEGKLVRSRLCLN